MPHVGISDLHLDRDFIDTLATEAQLNHVVQYEGMVEVVDSDIEEEKMEENVGDGKVGDGESSPAETTTELEPTGNEVTTMEV